MPPAVGPDPTQPASLVLAAIVLIAAGFLGWRQWLDVRRRAADLTLLDERHFARQDLRRLLGTIVLAVLAVALALGGRMPARVAGHANLKFIQVWSGVAFLILALVLLALLDSFATRAYGRRHRQRLTREGLAIVEAELRIKTAARRAEQARDANGVHPGLVDDDLD